MKKTWEYSLTLLTYTTSQYTSFYSWSSITMQSVKYHIPYTTSSTRPTPRGGTWYFHISLGSGHIFGGSKLWISIYIFGGSQKIYIFRVWRFCGYFLGSFQNLTIFEGLFYVSYGLFLKFKEQNGNIFFCFWMLRFKIFFFGMSYILDMFFGVQ